MNHDVLIAQLPFYQPILITQFARISANMVIISFEE